MTAATASQALDAIRRDPVGFCRTVLRFEPWSKQAEILESVRDHQRTAVRSAHGVGKTSTAARAVVWFLSAYPYSRVITTAPTFTQVRELLWREIAVGHAAADGFFDGQLFDTRLELGPDWFAIDLSTDRPERFAGHHAEHLLLVVDEASGVDERIYEAAEGFLTSQSARVLLIGNPTTTVGTFYSAFTSERALWNTISISAFDSPNLTGETVPESVARRLVSKGWVETAAKKWGEGSPLYSVGVLGDFPSQADNTETVIAVRRGSRVRIAQTYGKTDLMETADRILRVARQESAKELPATIVVDDIGIGGGLVDRLRLVQRRGGSEKRERISQREIAGLV
jgi:hypothetical protein